MKRDADRMQHDFDFKTEPYAHQREVFHRARDLDSFAFLMGMGTGKTKVTIDNGAWLWSQGKIKALVVIAPNGVHRNWILREVPAHLPEWTKYRAAVWASPSVLKAAERKALKKIWDEGDGLRVIAMNIEAFGQGRKSAAFKFLQQVTTAFPTMIAIDESSKIKNPTAQRTKALIAAGRGAEYRRILTGTPITNGPMDAFAQFAFLDKTILGFDNFYSYKHHFAEWKKETNHRQGHQYETLVKYQNLDELSNLIEAHSFRITKNECLDLPEKLYERRLVEMSKQQRKLYTDIRERALYDLGQGEVTLQNVLTKLLRLQQVIGGFVPADEGEVAGPIPGPNPRMEALLDVINEATSDGKIIIWSRFRAELDAITKQLATDFGRNSVVAYHGGVDRHDREENIDRFQNDPACNFFVGQQHSGGYGLTLTAATTMIYYSNDFSLEARLQSEDRAHRIGQKHNVTYVDLEAEGTVDSKIITALREKKNLADTITRDNPGTWL